MLQILAPRPLPGMRSVHHARDLVSRGSWQEKTSTHFRVFYQQNPAFAAAVLTYAEAYYSQIRLDLGLTHVVHRDQVPWLWDKRCQIYLYPHRQAYIQATGAPLWSGGFVRYPAAHDL